MNIKRLQCKMLCQLLILFISLVSISHAAQNSIPKTAMERSLAYKLNVSAEVTNIVIKFKEKTGIRFRNGVLLQSPTISLPTNIAVTDIVTGIEKVESIARSKNYNLNRLFPNQTEAQLDLMKSRGQNKSKRTLANLNLYHYFSIPAYSKYGDVENILTQLNNINIVEVAYAESKTQPASHIITPDFGNDQGYLDNTNNGIHAQYAWTQAGGRGDAVRIIDIEGAWQLSHEDLPTTFYDSGSYRNGIDWRNHGTAVLGVLNAVDNSFGITGIVSNAQVGVQSHNIVGGSASAIITASRQLGAGDILLLEMHRQGPADATACTCNFGQCNFLPVEYWQADFDAIETAVANGIIVVEAAGNGSVNFDDPVYNGLLDRNNRDSGAIIVGASQSRTRSPMCFTNFGQRVDVHAWGENVVTLGYNDLFNGGHNNENQFYTSTFSGTSSASPIVAGAVASIQGTNFTQNPNRAIQPREMRDLLVRTGTPQTNGTLVSHIGPLPNIQAALEDLFPPPPLDLSWLPAVISLILN